MKWTTQEDKKLKNLYLRTNLIFEDIEKIMGRSVPALSNRLTKLKVKRRFPLKFKNPSRITPALARIHAHVCGDGFMYSTHEKDIYGPWAKYRKNPIRDRYIIGYSNDNEELLKEFQRDIYKIFGIKTRKEHENEIRVKSKKMWDFLREMDAGDSYHWSIPRAISNGSREVMKNWIRAFFDDEADFDEDKNGIVCRIRVKCVNRNGLIQLLKMVNNFVPCNFKPKRGFYWGNTVCLNINKKDTPKYFSKIGSIRYKPGSRMASKAVS